MRIEAVTANDAEELLGIYSYYVEETAVSFEYETPSIEEFRSRIRTISAKYPYLKAIDDNGSIVGYAYAGVFKGRAAYDWSVETTVYVRKDCRRMGVGKLLYNRLEELLKGMGILNMNACIAVPLKKDKHLNNDSPLFHEKLGFTPVGTFHNSGYKFNTWYDMVWMEKIIGEHSPAQPPVAFGKWIELL